MEGREYTVEKVNHQESPLYRLRREAKKEWYDVRNYLSIFGAEECVAIHQVAQSQPSPEAKAQFDTLLTKLFVKWALLLENLDKYQSSDISIQTNPVYRLFLRLVEDTETRSILSTLHPGLASLFNEDYESKEELCDRICVFFKDNKDIIMDVDDVDLFDLTLAYAQNVSNDLEKIYSEKIPLLKEKVKSNFERARQRGILPVTADSIEHVFATTPVHIDDGVLVMARGAMADYNLVDGLVRLSTGIPEEMWGACLTHEFVHALAGKTMVVVDQLVPMSKPEFTSNPISKSDFFPLRNGLRFAPFGRGGGLDYGPRGKSLFTWLDEGITESIAQIILKVSGEKFIENSYLYETILLVFLRKHFDGDAGERLLFFLNAYFEHYSQTKKPTLPRWKALNEQLSKKFGPRILVNLDKFFALKATEDDPKIGIKLAIEKLETDPGGLGEYLREEIKKSKLDPVRSP